MKILIVDDDPLVVAGLEAVLLLHDFDVVGAGDCATAEEKVAGEFFPLILADVRLRTEADGLRLLESARRMSPQSCIASMTGYFDVAMEQRTRERSPATCAANAPGAIDGVCSVIAPGRPKRARRPACSVFMNDRR